MATSVIQFSDPIKGGGSCSVCTASYSPDPVTVLEIGSQSPYHVRLCRMHLKVLREAVLKEYLKRVVIPGAPQRRREGGLPEGERI